MKSKRAKDGRGDLCDIVCPDISYVHVRYVPINLEQWSLSFILYTFFEIFVYSIWLDDSTEEMKT